ncbi:amino acid decarboxylase [Niastella yeongjuensis]|uniref:Amino acid decarboxylase n=1 Tax=Niastella yeongjuensis TaxID=354355 RepID=A0A1V9EMZ3_9BACT|nr:pyridoxal-dependent decarboxylase [Niastella yeongjuensis]OQP47533.1 amino acid decarboxylase [Niastella yeongjuensis]
MKKEALLTEEKTLDPQDWSTLNELGHRMLDDLFYYLETTRQRPVYTKPPANVLASMNQPLPETPEGTTAVYEDFFANVLPYNINNIHPRFWAWVQGGGSPFGMLADMLASGMNANVSLGDSMPMYVEKQVLNWSKEMMGFPSTASGLLLSGASLANITALIVARHHANHEIKTKGLQAVQGPLTIYGSSETHNCVVKGVEVIGIGSDNFRKVPVDADYRIDVEALRRMIVEDRAAGCQPFCIVGNAGTVNTGAIDPLDELAALAKEFNLWLHVDGAFGAIPKLLPEFAGALNGLELADSLSFDFHKWMYVNYEAACVLIRDPQLHREAFTSAVNYLTLHERGLSAGPEAFNNLGMELSRGFKALKIWMLLKQNGLETYRTLIRQNLQQAQYLAELIQQHPELELLAPVPLNIVCFRYNAGNCSAEKLNKGNKELLMRLHEQGIAAPSYTVLNDKYAIRAAITNHRSKFSDFELLVNEVIRIGKEVFNSKF